MNHFDRPEEKEDPNELRSAAVDALRHAARQTDPQEFSRLTRRALALIERARVIRHDREHAVSEAAEAQVLQGDAVVRPGLSDKIIKFIVRVWRCSA